MASMLAPTILDVRPVSTGKQSGVILSLGRNEILIKMVQWTPRSLTRRLGCFISKTRMNRRKLTLANRPQEESCI